MVLTSESHCSTAGVQLSASYWIGAISILTERLLTVWFCFLGNVGKSTGVRLFFCFVLVCFLCQDLISATELHPGSQVLSFSLCGLSNYDTRQ